MKLKYLCRECNCDVLYDCTKNITTHIKKEHKMTPQQYYDKYIKQEKENLCVICGNETSFCGFMKGYNKTCCVECRYKNTVLETQKTCQRKYGTNNGGWSEISQEKIKKYFNEKYGTDFYNNREKYKQTCKERYGTESVFSVETVKNKIKKTMKSRYGVENILSSETVKLQIENTNLIKYGCKRPLQNESIKEKMIKTCMEKYGVENPLASKDIREKGKISYYNKTGYWHNSQNPENNKKRCKRYTYNNIPFDSSWELAYYIWLKDNNIVFEYQPEPLKYYWVGDDKFHNYYVDFKLENEYVEIKNNFLYNNMIIENDSKENAKYKCMLNNNVKIINDCSEFLTYIKNKYGKNFLEQFRNGEVK